jgi:hypothetical protein
VACRRKKGSTFIVGSIIKSPLIHHRKIFVPEEEQIDHWRSAVHWNAKSKDHPGLNQIPAEFKHFRNPEGRRPETWPVGDPTRSKAMQA